MAGRPSGIPSADPKVICAPPSLLALLRSYVDVDAGEGGDIVRPLTPDAYIAQNVVLAKVLSTTVAAGTDTYRVQDTHVGLITEIRAHILPQNLNSDVAFSFGGATVTDPRVVRFLRGQNCKISLQNQVRNEFLLGAQGVNNGNLCLADLDTVSGAAPVRTDDLGTYAIIPPGDTISMSVALMTQNANIENSSGAEFGVNISMILLRRKRG